jgi:hypothetical protein
MAGKWINNIEPLFDPSNLAESIQPKNAKARHSEHDLLLLCARTTNVSRLYEERVQAITTNVVCYR